MNPSKTGNYVKVNGEWLPVTGVAQRAFAADMVRAAHRSTAPITRWDGVAWTDTGTVLHASTPEPPSSPVAGRGRHKRTSAAPAVPERLRAIRDRAAGPLVLSAHPVTILALAREDIAWLLTYVAQREAAFAPTANVASRNA